MSRLRPFFSYYGAKWTLAPKYPKPQHSTIIEPFAGSACYSLLYPDHDVILIERDPKVAAVWRYLLSATVDEIAALPLLAPGDRADALDVCDGARFLIGFWINPASSQPKVTMRGDWAAGSIWGERMRDRIASNIDRIRHWRLIEGDFSDAPDIEAAWHVDPPYQGRAGSYYRQKFDRFIELSQWCQSRRGQVMVCENEGADWLPFEPLRVTVGTPTANKARARRSAEVIWTNGPRDEGGQCLLDFTTPDGGSDENEPTPLR